MLNRGKTQCSSMQRVFQYLCLSFHSTPSSVPYSPVGNPSKYVGPLRQVGEHAPRECMCIVSPDAQGGYWHGNCVDSSQALVPAGNRHSSFPSPFCVDLVEWLVGCSGHGEHSPIYKEMQQGLPAFLSLQRRQILISVSAKGEGWSQEARRL